MAMDPRVLADEELVDDLIVFARYLHPEAGLLKKGPCKYKVHNRCVRLVVKQEDGCLPELYVADGPLEQPLGDYIKDSGRKETWNQNPAYQTALHSIPPEARISFEEVYPETRWEAMGVAVQEAEAREQHAQHVKTAPPAPSSATPSPRGGITPPSLLSAMLPPNPLAPAVSQAGLYPPAKISNSFMPPPMPPRSLSRHDRGSHAPRALSAPRVDNIALQGEGMLMRPITPAPNHGVGASARSATPPPLVAPSVSPTQAYRSAFSPGPTARSITPSRLVSASTASPGLSYRTNAASPGPTYRSGIASPSPALSGASPSPSTRMPHARTWASPTPGTPMTPSTPNMSVRPVQWQSQQFSERLTPRDGRSLSPVDARAVDTSHLEVQHAMTGVAATMLAGKSTDMRSRPETFTAETVHHGRPSGAPRINSPMVVHREHSHERSDSVPPLLRRHPSESLDMKEMSITGAIMKDFPVANGIGQTARLERQNSKYMQRDHSPSLADFHQQCQPSGFSAILPPASVSATPDVPHRMGPGGTQSPALGMQSMPPSIHRSQQNHSATNITRNSNVAIVRVPSPVVLGSYRSGNTYDSHADASVDTRRSRGPSLPRAASPESFSAYGCSAIYQTPEKANGADAMLAGPATGTTTTPIGTPISRSRAIGGIEGIFNPSPVIPPRACTPGDSARLSVSPARSPLVELRQLRPGNPHVKIDFSPLPRDHGQEAARNRSGLGSLTAAPARDTGHGTPRRSGTTTPAPVAVAPATHVAAVLNSAPFLAPAAPTSLLRAPGCIASAVPQRSAWEQHGPHVLNAGNLRSSIVSGFGGIGTSANRNHSRGQRPRSQTQMRH